MVESKWPELGGKEIRYADHTWKLTGVVDVQNTGELLEVEVVQVDDVRHGRASLRFSLESPPASLNPGDLGGHFDSLERDRDQYAIVVKKDRRVYRYRLQGMTHR